PGRQCHDPRSIGPCSPSAAAPPATPPDTTPRPVLILLCPQPIPWCSAAAGSPPARRSSQQVLWRPHLPAQELPGGRLRQRRLQPHVPRVLVGRDPLLAEGPQ